MERLTGGPTDQAGGLSESSRRRVVIVIGSNRAGTSAVTRLLGMLGLELGPDDELLGGINADNAKGFHEHREFLRINQAILSRLGGSWSRPPCLEPGWTSDPRLDDLRARARELIERDFAESPTWGFKDPRTSLTLPFWKELLAPAGYVICYRNPLSVGQSLKRRNEMPVDQGIDLWTQYTAGGIASTAGERRVFIAYEHLFTRREEAIARLAAFMHATEVSRGEEFRAAVDGWLEDDLHHNQRQLREFLTHPAVSPDARSLFLMLELISHVPTTADGSSSGESKELLTALDAFAQSVLDRQGLPT